MPGSADKVCPTLREKNNKQLLEEILSEIGSLKSAVSEIRLEIAKLNRIEQKLKNGENLATSNGGWFSWS